MKVRLKDIKSNPWRYVNKGYPIDQGKVEKLRSSIKRTGFWDNLVARQVKEEVQIAYGHHRVEALRKEFGPEHEIEMIMRDIDDGQMLKIMAAENDAMDIMSPAVINETVRAARDYLRKNKKEELAIRETVLTKYDDGIPREHEIIAAFLAWKPSRVHDAMCALTDMDKGIIERKEYESIPFQAGAEAFRKAVKEHRLPKQVRDEIVKELQAGTMGKRGVEAAVMKYKLVKPHLQKARDDKEITINKVAEGVIEGLLLASTNMTEKFVENWHYVSKENRGRILFAAKSVFAKFNTLQKKEKKLLEVKRG